MPPGSPFGPNLRAFVIYLRFVHAISFERLVRLMSDLFGLAISEGALVALLADSRPAFARQRSLIRARLLAGSVLQSDETSVRVGKRNWWLWTFHHGRDCCFVIRASRGKDVVAEFLGDVRPAFWVSDRFGSQLGWASSDHQICLAHLIRDARYAVDAGDTTFCSASLDAAATSLRNRAPRPSAMTSTGSRSPHSRHDAQPNSCDQTVMRDQVTAGPTATRTVAAPIRDFLRDILANGPVLQKIVVERGAAHGFNLDQLRRARKTIGAVAYKRCGENLSSPWMWCLPEHVPADAEME